MRRSQYLALTAAAAGVLGVVGYGATVSLAAPAHNARTAKVAPALKLAKVSVKQGSATTRAPVLVTAKGRAVYLLTGDSVKHPLCTSMGCLGAWPAVTSSAKKPVLGAGVKGKLTIWNHKGMRQLVLDGHPLYTFAGDKTAGVADGQGLASGSDVWKLLGANGAAVPIAAAPAGGTTSTSGTTASGSSTSGTTSSGSSGAGSGSDSGSGSTGSTSSQPSASGNPSASGGSGPASSVGGSPAPTTPGKTTPSTSSTPSGSTTPAAPTTPSGTTTPSGSTTPSGATTPSSTPSTTTPPPSAPPVDNWA